MKLNLVIVLIFLTIYCTTTVIGVTAQLDIGGKESANNQRHVTEPLRLGGSRFGEDNDHDHENHSGSRHYSNDHPGGSKHLYGNNDHHGGSKHLYGNDHQGGSGSKHFYDNDHLGGSKHFYGNDHHGGSKHFYDHDHHGGYKHLYSNDHHGGSRHFYDNGHHSGNRYSYGHDHHSGSRQILGHDHSGSVHGHGHDHGGSKHGHVEIVPQSLCLIKADPGYCNLIVGRWYYDHRYHRCLPFLYTGCGGNPNNFTSLKKCEGATRHCQFINTRPDPVTKYAIMNPMNPLGSLANGYVLAG